MNGSSTWVICHKSKKKQVQIEYIECFRRLKYTLKKRREENVIVEKIKYSMQESTPVLNVENEEGYKKSIHKFLMEFVL